MSNFGAFMIALAIAVSGYGIEMAIRKLSVITVEQTTTVRFSEEKHGSQ